MTYRPEDAQGRAAAGVPGDHPADRQRVHRDDEGHRAGLVPRCRRSPSAEIFRRAQLVGKADFKTSRPTSSRPLSTGGSPSSSRSSRRGSRSGCRPRLRPRTSAVAGHGPAPASQHGDERHAGMSRRDVVVRVDGLHKSLRAPRGAQGRRPGGAPGRGRGDLRPLRVGQVDAAALRQLPRGPDRGLDRGRRHPARGRPPHPPQARADPPAAAARRHGLPAVQPVPAHDRARERHRGARSRVKGQRRRGRRERAPRSSSTRSGWPTRRTSTRSGCPAASSSGSPSPGRWPWSPR